MEDIVYTVKPLASVALTFVVCVVSMSIFIKPYSIQVRSGLVSGFYLLFFFCVLELGAWWLLARRWHRHSRGT